MSSAYEDDQSLVDGSDNITIDNWKPRAKSLCIPKSEWRKKQINGNYNSEPGIDELKKIRMYLKRKYPDYQIMDAFGINCETLVAIKKGCYGPVDGISLDNQSKIYKEFERINKKIDRFIQALRFISDNFMEGSDSAKRMAFKTIIGINKKTEKENALLE